MFSTCSIYVHKFQVLPAFHMQGIDNFTDIESKLRRIEEDPEGSGTSHLFNCMQQVTSTANRAFEPLFERQVHQAIKSLTIQISYKIRSLYLHSI